MRRDFSAPQIDSAHPVAHQGMLYPTSPIGQSGGIAGVKIQQPD
jgi:hypothetical protein